MERDVVNGELTASEPTGPFASRRLASRRLTLQAVLLALLTVLPSVGAEATQKNVLILSGGRGRVSINQMESSLRAHFSEPVNFSIVDLDNPPRFELKSYQENFAEALRAGYAGEKLDLVITVMTVPLEFAVQYRDKLFPGVPIVFMSVSSRLPEKLWPGVTGVVSPMGVPETIDLALHLQPDTQAIAIIGQLSGSSGIDNDWFLAEHTELLRYRNRVSEIDLLGPASPELLQKVAELPPHTVVLFQLYPQDANQPAFGAFDVLAAVAERFPTYSILPHITLGRGGIGGASYDPTKDAASAGQLAARVLSGERPDSIPVVHNSHVSVSVDWRELRRWNIPESALPPSTVVLYRELSLWERGKWIFITGLAAILLLSALAAYLLYGRVQLKRARDAQTQLSRLLIGGQEKERSRLATELHDDFSQRVALLAVQMESVADTISLSPQEAEKQLRELTNSTSEIGADLHTLSHRLHSSTLESLGLVPALRALCKEISSQQGIEIDFRSDNIPRSVGQDTALCVFRIVQEGLRNAKKYSGVKKADVELRRANGSLHLTVRDEGRGFDSNNLQHHEGLGLRSMRERAYLVGGQFQIHSAVGKGTTIEVCVPLQSTPD
jgi:signal transduction histidine kinase